MGTQSLRHSNAGKQVAAGTTTGNEDSVWGTVWGRHVGTGKTMPDAGMVATHIPDPRLLTKANYSAIFKTGKIRAHIT